MARAVPYARGARTRPPFRTCSVHRKAVTPTASGRRRGEEANHPRGTRTPSHPPHLPTHPHHRLSAAPPQPPHAPHLRHRFDAPPPLPIATTPRARRDPPSRACTHAQRNCQRRPCTHAEPPLSSVSSVPLAPPLLFSCASTPDAPPRPRRGGCTAVERQCGGRLRSRPGSRAHQQSATVNPEVRHECELEATG